MDTNLTIRFIDTMTDRILNDEWAPNEHLPSFRKLTEQYGVSRSVINTAIACLEQKGYVDIIERKGAIVRDWRKNASLSIINDAIERSVLVDTLVYAMFDVLTFSLCSGAQQAVHDTDETALARLKRLTEAQTSTKDNETVFKTHFEFFDVMTKMCASVSYSILFLSIESAFKNMIKIFMSDESLKQQCIKMQASIYTSIATKDGQKAKWETEALIDNVKTFFEHKMRVL